MIKVLLINSLIWNLYLLHCQEWLHITYLNNKDIQKNKQKINKCNKIQSFAYSFA